MALNLQTNLFVDTTDEECLLATSIGNRCRALISEATQCNCRKVGGTDFCSTHKLEVARITAGYQYPESLYSSNHSIDNLRRAKYVSSLTTPECQRVLNLLYEETAARMWLSYVYFNDFSWGLIDARNRNNHVKAIYRREEAIKRLEKYCHVD